MGVNKWYNSLIIIEEILPFLMNIIAILKIVLLLFSKEQLHSKKCSLKIWEFFAKSYNINKCFSDYYLRSVSFK